MSKLAIASDHGGFRLKSVVAAALTDMGVAFDDLGTQTMEPCDYPDFANALARGIAEGRYERGVLICGTGVGMSITANRHRGVRAAVVSDTYSARMAREHNDANVLCLGDRVVGPGLAVDILRTWLSANPDPNPRHALRLRKIDPPEG